MKAKLIMVLLTVTVAAWGVPAKRVSRVVTQPDGTRLTLTARGDECMHYFVADDGTPMALDEATGWWRATELQGDDVRRARARAAADNERRMTRASRASAFKGRKRGIVILAEFPDRQFTVYNPKQVFDDMFNKEGYFDYGMGGSVRDYFLAQSYGQLDIHFDIVGPVTVSQNMAYYGANDLRGHDKHPGEFVREAVEKASWMVNFSHYDWDRDGEVDQVYVIYAGYGEAQAQSQTSLIWPHEWTLADAGVGKLVYNGVTINTYACSNELYGSYGTTVDGIGTACHEFSHCLGLPDMYDTTGKSFGMDAWDLLDYGCYNADGYVPASYTAYERWYVGWKDPIVLDDGCEVRDMRNIDEGGDTYVIYNRARNTEYYMLQNIQQTGWNVGAAASGMLVIHVDYSSVAWRNNTVNDVASHQRMAPVCADNLKTIKSLAGDLWPLGEKDSLTDLSQPATTLFNMNDDGTLMLGRPVTNIRHEDGVLSFTFNGGPDSGDGITPPDASAPQHYYDLLGRRYATPPRRGVYIIR